MPANTREPLRIAAIVAAWNGADYVPACLDSIIAGLTAPDLIIVSDDASTDQTLDVVRRVAAGSGQRLTIELLQSARNTGFTSAANRGLRHALTRAEPLEVILLLNQDTLLHPEAIRQLCRLFASDQTIGVVGGKLLYPDHNTLQHAGGYLERPRMVSRHFGHGEPAEAGCHDAVRDVDFVTGAALALRTACLRRVGLFDEIFSPGYFEDVELCQRIRADGWRVVYTPAVVITHLEARSFTDDLQRWRWTHRNRIIFALRSLGPSKFRDVFFPAEAAWVRQAELFQLRAACTAYAEVLIRLPQIRRATARAPEEPDSTIDTLAELRRSAIERLFLLGTLGRYRPLRRNSPEACLRSLDDPPGSGTS